MAPVAANTCGQSVTATLKKYAALVPMDTSVFMLAERWRSSREESRVELPAHPELDRRGQGPEQDTGSRSQCGAQEKTSCMLPSSTGTDRTAPDHELDAAGAAFSRARSACSRSAASGVAAISAGTV